MEAQLERPSHGHEGGAHSAVEEGEQKKSVLKKVKDKAKKIKDTIKKHGHVGGDQGHHHQTNVDGGPMCESSVVRSTDLPRGNNTLENPRTESPAEDPHSPNTTPANIPRIDHRQQPSNTEHKDSSDVKDSSDKPLTESASEYAHKLAETVGPVYEKVAGAVSEKLKPGDDDKAMSEVITDTLLHKKNGDDKEAAPPPPPRAKVTVSKEVAERLGTESKREGEDAVAAGEQSTGETMGESLQNAVTNWLAGSTGIQTAQDSVYHAFVNDDASSSTSGPGPKGEEPEPRHR